MGIGNSAPHFEKGIKLILEQMKKNIGVLFGFSLLVLSLMPFRSEAQVVAFGYFTINEKCPDTEGFQRRCRPDGPDWCQVSQQTTCPEYEGIG